jgi:hypothetical protein|tara:strand:- start:135 stop:1151 length:1017 start_codon:yes stop_codon:yes gene_type:complete
MSAYKQFLSSDINVTPFEVSKGFSYKGVTQLTDSGGGVDRFLGTNILGLFNPTTDPTTGTISTQYQRLIYNSAKELYYSNYLSSSYGDNVQTASLIPGTNELGDRFVGSPQSPGLYYNYPQTNLTFEKFFPTGSGEAIGVFSVPSGLYGKYIQPKSFFLSSDEGDIRDDGEGNLINQTSNNIVGNIFYAHGLAVITNKGFADTGGVYGTGLYGTALYGTTDLDYINSFITSTNITCSFSSSLTIYETQYKCTLRDNEYNFTLNPSVSSGSTETTSSIGTFFTPGQYLNDFATGSEFSPYISTVGLYDNDYNLLAVGKLSQPLPISPTTDTTILINIDK